MTLDDVLSVTFSAIKIIKHGPNYQEIFLSRECMEHSNEEIYKYKKGLIQYAEYEILSMNTYHNGVECILTILI